MTTLVSSDIRATPPSGWDVPARWRRVSREAAVIGLGNVLVAWGGVAGVRLLSTSLGPRGYGELALLITAANFAQQALYSPLSQSSFRYFAVARETGGLRRYLRQTHAVFLCIAGLLAGVAGVGAAVVGLCGKGRLAWAVLGAAVLAILTGYNTLLDGFQNAARNRVAVAVHQALLQWARPLAAVAAISCLGASSAVALGGLLAASAVVLISQRLVFGFTVRAAFLTAPPAAEAAWMPRILNYAKPMMVWGVLAWLQGVSDRWFLAAFRGTAAVGVYSVAYQLGYYPILLAASAVAQVVLPILFGRAGDGIDRARLGSTLEINQKLVLLHFVLSLAAASAAWAAGGPLIAWLVAPAYRPAGSYLPWMVLAGGLTATGNAACNAFLAAGAPRGIMLPRVANSLLSMALHCGGAWQFGTAGVVAANVTAAAVYCGWLSLRARRLTRQTAAA